MAYSKAFKQANKQRIKTEKHFNRINRRIARAQKRINEKAANASVSKDNSSINGFSISFLLISLLLIISLVRSLTGAPSLTFSGFLNSLDSIPDIGLNFKLETIVIGDWGALNFIRNFLNLFVVPLNITIFIFKLLLNLLIVVFWFLRFFFV